MGDFFYGEQANIFSFYRFPKALFTDSRFRGISVEAKVLYGLLLDRMGLSVKNGWKDEEGRVYIIFTVEAIMEHLGCSNKKAVGLLRELDEKADLIERRRPAQLDLCEDLHGCPEMTILEVSEVHFRRCRFDTSRSVESTP